MSSHIHIIEKLVNFLLPGVEQLSIPSALDLNLANEITESDLWSDESLVSLSTTIERNNKIYDRLKDAKCLDEMMSEKVIIDFLRMNMFVVLDTYLSNSLIRSSMKLSSKPPFPGGNRVDFDEDLLEELLTNAKRKARIYKEIYE